MREALSGDGISSTLLTMGVWATTRAVTGDLDAHTPCKYPASSVPIPGVHIEVVYGTRGYTACVHQQSVAAPTLHPHSNPTTQWRPAECTAQDQL